MRDLDVDELSEEFADFAPLEKAGDGRQGLLGEAGPIEEALPATNDEELLAELEEGLSERNITELRHVSSSAERREAEEVATRTKCEDFDRFKPLIETVESEIELGSDGGESVGLFQLGEPV